MAATLSSVRELNVPGFRVFECDVTWDAAAGAIAQASGNIATGMENSTPVFMNAYMTTNPADDSVAAHTEYAYTASTGNVVVRAVSVKKDASAAGDLSGAVSRVVIVFPDVRSQDGDSLYGSGNTGPTF